MTVNALQLIDNLLPENDQVLFNLFYLFADCETSFWETDGSSYLIGQTDKMRPVWIWIKDGADDTALRRIQTVICERLALNPNLKVTADADKITDILQNIAAKNNLSLQSETPMVIYRCDKVTNPKQADGRCILSNDGHKDILARFITGMIRDLADRDTYDGEAEDFANSVAGSPDMFLWEADDEAVSMAMITHRAEKYARINTVFTDHAHRGKGYAGMLMSEVTQRVIDENRVPMLYTEKDNVCSNAVYKRIGYQLCGELVGFTFAQQD